MRLIEFDGTYFHFDFSVREWRWFNEILEIYPFIPVSHHRLSKLPDEAEGNANQKLLEEAMAEHRAENKRRVQAMLHGPGRSKKHQASRTRFRLAAGESEWLLQILNDVRVGCWIRLGQPTDTRSLGPDISPETARYVWGLELCGYFQTVLLDALSK